MQRYRAYGQEDDQPLVVGDEHFIGVDEYSNPENVQPAYVQQAVNADFTSLNAETRGGFVCLPELGNAPFGMKWNEGSIGATGNGFAWSQVIYGQNKFVAVGGNTVAYSIDGLTWTKNNIEGFDYSIQRVTYENGVFILTGASASFADPARRGIMVSSDAITWTKPATAPARSYLGVQYANGKWVAIGASGLSTYNSVAISTDNGATWTETTNVAPLQFIYDIAFGNGLFVAVSSGGYGIFVSTNGITWTSATTDYFSYYYVAFGNGVFIAINDLGHVSISSDGYNWTFSANLAENLHDIIFANGRFIIFGTSTPIFTSISGTEWLRYTHTNSSPFDVWYALAYGNGKYLAVSDTTKTLYSTNVVDVIYGSNIYSDPQEIGTSWIMLLGGNSVGFYSFGHNSRQVSLGSYNVTEQSTIVQANNYVYIFRGDDQTPLYWNGDWNTSFTVVPPTSLPATYNSVPNSNQATYYQNRLWVRSGKDSIAASDVLAFTDYDPLANSFNLNTGNSDFVVATFPFAQNSLICFKNKSIELMQNVEGSLSDVTVTEITRQVGLVGINAVTSVGPDLAYVSYGNINLLTLTTTNNSLQHKTLPLSARIRRIMNRVNWNVGYKISIGYWNNKIYVSLPLDNSLFCNAVVVYNFINESWYGEWNFSPDMNMCIQGWAVNDYLGLQRLHAITEDGRIFVTDEGQNDISGTTVSEISFNLVTRAYHLDHGSNENRGASFNHFQRRMYADLSTNRPQISIASYTDGASEESTLLTNQTYTRSQSWLFNDSAYDLTNANNDYNRAYRRDYSTGPASVQTGSGFLPEMRQDIRIPLITRRQGRLSWLEVSNTQGYLMLKSIGFENRAGQRSSYVQA